MAIGVLSYVTGEADDDLALQRINASIREMHDKSTQIISLPRFGSLRFTVESGMLSVVTPSGLASDVGKAIAWVVLVKGLEKTLMHRESALTQILEYSNNLLTVQSLFGRKLYEIGDPMAVLSSSEKKAIQAITANMTAVDKATSEALSVYLRKATSVSEIKGDYTVPVVKHERIERVGAEEKLFPAVIKAFLVDFSEVTNFMTDTSLNIKSDVYSAYAQDTEEYLQESIAKRIDTQFFKKWVNVRFFKSRPLDMTYENRVAWYSFVCNDIKVYLDKFFNYSFNPSVRSVVPYVRIESSDNPHELKNYFSNVNFRHGARSASSCRAPSIMLEMVVLLIDSNVETRLAPVLAMVTILLWYSIYGTNKTRLKKRYRYFINLRNPKGKRVDMQAVDDYANRKSVSSGVNIARYVCRYYSSVTFYSRKMLGITRNNWRSLMDIEGILAYDTVDALPVALVPKDWLRSYARACEYIRFNSNVTRGGEYGSNT
uniref:p55 n=1 Tax=Pineapple mealybug wilt-associated virus 2 TaxID=136234 RepID=A0A6M4EG47_9CLOS|nr:p55 [Pineapple mealybug wilt-associated virus 2]